MEPSSSGSIYIDNYNEDSILSYKNSSYTVNNSTKIAVSAIKVEFCQKKNIVNDYLQFDVRCDALDNHMNQSLCSAHFAIDKNCYYEEIILNDLIFTTNNSNVILRHIILIYKNYG